MSAADVGVSVPTLLGRAAAGWGVVSFVCGVAGVIACFVPGAILGGALGLALGLGFGLWSVTLLVRAFRLRRLLIVERHIRELTELLGQPPPIATVIAETGCHERDARRLLSLPPAGAPTV